MLIQTRYFRNSLAKIFSVRVHNNFLAQFHVTHISKVRDMLVIGLFFGWQSTGFGQQINVLELPDAQKAPPPAIDLDRRSENEQRDLYLSKTARIRSHHRNVPLQNTVKPFSAAINSVPVLVAPRLKETMFKNNLTVLQRRTVTGSTKDGGANLNYNWASPISEPTVAARGNEIFVTGNWYAAFSLDGGTSFKSIDPFSMFKKQNPAINSFPGPSSLDASSGSQTNVSVAQDVIANNELNQSNFCCDQIVLYDKHTDAMFWFMQGIKDTSGNLLRLLIARGENDIRTNNWFYYDLPASSLLQREGSWIDFPDVSVSEKFVYITANVFRTDNDRFEGALVIRVEKHALANYKKVNASAIFLRNIGSLRLVQGAADVMYWGAHLSQSTVNIWKWADTDVGAVGPTSIEVDTWDIPNEQNTQTSLAPNKKPWLKRADGRITAGWKSGSNIGFAWTAGADNRFLYPHVRVAVVNQDELEKSFSSTDSISAAQQPHIWSKSFATAYPAAAPNREGEVGMILSYGGPKHFPSQAIGVFSKNLNDDFFLTEAAVGINTPICPRENNVKDFDCGVFGDYFTIRPDGIDPKAWVTVGYSLKNKDQELLRAESEFFKFRSTK